MAHSRMEPTSPGRWRMIICRRPPHLPRQRACPGCGGATPPSAEAGSGLRSRRTCRRQSLSNAIGYPPFPGPPGCDCGGHLGRHRGVACRHQKLTVNQGLAPDWQRQVPGSGARAALDAGRFRGRACLTSSYDAGLQLQGFGRIVIPRVLSPSAVLPSLAGWCFQPSSNFGKGVSL